MMPSAPPNPSTPEAVRKTGPGIMKADDSCSTQDTGACTSPGQHTSASTDGKGTEEAALMV